MNFALNSKYSEIDLEEVSPADLVLIGGGCGESGGGSVSVSSVQAAAQSASVAPGANMNVTYNVNSPLNNGYVPVIYWFQGPRGNTGNGTANVEQSSGHVTASSSSGGGGFWASVSSFFGWLFGSH